MIKHECEMERRRREVWAIKQSAGAGQTGRGTLPGLWACRMAGALTQQDLAKQAGIGRATIRGLERGDRRAHATTIRKLCAALGVEPSDLLSAKVSEEEE